MKVTYFWYQGLDVSLTEERAKGKSITAAAHGDAEGCDTSRFQHFLDNTWGLHGSDYEECRLLGYNNTVLTSQETLQLSTTQPSQLMMCHIWGFNGGDYEECRLLGYNTHFVPHRRHITSPLQRPAGQCYVRFHVFTVATIKNVVFWDIKTQFAPNRRHITSPLHSPAC
jgi:hypothetical protein